MLGMCSRVVGSTKTRTYKPNVRLSFQGDGARSCVGPGVLGYAGAFFLPHGRFVGGELSSAFLRHGDLIWAIVYAHVSTQNILGYTTYH